MVFDEQRPDLDIAVVPLYVNPWVMPLFDSRLFKYFIYKISKTGRLPNAL